MGGDSKLLNTIIEPDTFTHCDESYNIPRYIILGVIRAIVALTVLKL